MYLLRQVRSCGSLVITIATHVLEFVHIGVAHHLRTVCGQLVDTSRIAGQVHSQCVFMCASIVLNAAMRYYLILHVLSSSI
eukprot:5988293-Pyramimonas_sp.AAC.1